MIVQVPKKTRAIYGVNFKILMPIVIGLSACSVPDYQASAVLPPANYSFVAPPPDLVALDAQNALSFNDPVLVRLVNIALEDNLSIAEAGARLKEASADLRGEGAGRLSGDLNYNVTDSSAAGASQALSLGVSLNPFGLTRSRLSAAAARFDAAKLSELDARRLVISELASTYVDYRFFQQLLIFRKQDLRVRRSILRDVRAQSDSGQATRVDLVRTRAQVAEAEVEIPTLEATIIQTRNQISTLLGKSVGGVNVDLSFQGEQPHPHGNNNIGVPADMIRARPDIQRAERLYSAALSDIDVAEASRYPRLSLSGTIRAPLESGDPVKSLVGGLVLPLFTQKALALDIESAQARADQAFIQWRSAVLNAVEDVESNLAAVQGTQKAISAARRVVALNRESLTLSRDLLSSGGNTTVLAILDREQEVANAQITLAQNLRSLGLNYVALRTALGVEQVPAELIIQR